MRKLDGDFDLCGIWGVSDISESTSAKTVSCLVVRIKLFSRRMLESGIRSEARRYTTGVNGE